MALFFLKYYLVFIVVIIALFFIGFAIRKLLFSKLVINGPFTLFFVCTLMGFTAFTAVFSYARSSFVTVNSGLLFIALFAWLESRRQATPEVQAPSASYTLKQLLFPLLSFLALSIPIFIYGALKMYKGGIFPLTVISGQDYSYNSIISETLAIQGIENKFIPEQLLSAEYHGIIFYHYFDLWFNACVSNIFHLNNYVSYITITDSMMIFLAVAGMAAVWERLFRANIITFGLAVVLVLFSSYHFPFYNTIHYLSKEFYNLHHFGESPLYTSKLLQLMPFATLAGLCFVSRKAVFAFLALLCCVVIYFSTGPVLIVSIGAIAVLNFYFKFFDTKEGLRTIGYVAVIAVFFGVFYKVFGTGLTEGKDSLTIDLFNPQHLKTRINIMGLTVIQSAVLYFPVLLIYGALFLMVKNKEHRKFLYFILLFCALIYGAGLSAWAVAFMNQDGMQILGNNLPVINVLLAVSIISMLSAIWSGREQQVHWLKYGALGLLLALSVYKVIFLYPASADKQLMAAQYSDQYLLDIAETNKNAEKPLIGAVIKGDEEYLDKEYAFAHICSQTWMSPWYLVFTPQYLATLNINLNEAPLAQDTLDRVREQKYVEGTLIYKLIEEQKKNGTYVSNAKSQVDLIDKYHLTYLIATRSAVVSPEMQQRVDKVITDPVSGERFMLLKNP